MSLRLDGRVCTLENSILMYLENAVPGREKFRGLVFRIVTENGCGGCKW